MRSRLLALAVVMALLALAVIQHTTSAAEPQTDAANAAVHYIEGLQNADGGFPAFGPDSSAGSTIDAVFALKAAGVDPTTVTNNGHAAADYLASQASAYAGRPGGAAKLALGVSVMGLDPSHFGGVDLNAAMVANVNVTTGQYGQDLFAETLYILAVVGPGQTVPAATLSHLRSAQLADGGWEFSGGAGSDSNTTAMALQALLSDHVSASDATIIGGLGYLHTAQNADGGFAFAAGSDGDPNSTALVIQALVAADQNIDAGGPWDRHGHSPLDALLSFQNQTTGAFQFGGQDSPFATYQALPALMLAPFPGLRTQQPPPVTPTPTSQPPTVTPTRQPTAPTTAPLMTATALPSIALPHSGGAPRGASGEPWWPVAVLSAGGAALVVGVAVLRRRRSW